MVGTAGTDFAFPTIEYVALPMLFGQPENVMLINSSLDGSSYTVCVKFVLNGDFSWSVKGQ